MRSAILVATDGSPHAFGALHLAHALAAHDDRPLHVLAVLEPVGLPHLGGRYPLSGSLSDVERRLAGDLEQAIREQLDRLGVYEPGCQLSVRTGSPALTVACFAVEIEAAQIVIGLARTTALERMGASEMPLRVVQLANVPVLAVPRSMEALPRRAVVAIDFSDFSLEAARAAHRLIGTRGELHLVHVPPAQPQAYGWWPVEAESLDRDRADAEARLEALAGELERRAPGTARTALLSGPTAAAVLEYARSVDADLVAAGTHGYGFITRLVLGSVSTRLLRGSEGAVLLVPPAAVVPEIAEPQGAAAGGSWDPAALGRER